jgi:hypothetical protein
MGFSSLCHRSSVALMILLSGCSINVVQSQQSCLANNITKGDTLDAECESVCAPSTFETFDWGAVSEDGSDPDTVIRTWSCNCLEAPTANFICFDSEEVWDLSVGTVSCDEYNITSGGKCTKWCKENIDPKAIEFVTKNGEITCSCAGFKICSGNQVDDDILASGGVAVVVATLSSSLLAVVGLFL